MLRIGTCCKSIPISLSAILVPPKRSSAKSTKNSRARHNFRLSDEGAPSLGTDIRSVVVGSYVIFYTVGPGAITIVRVLHGRRDIDAEFRR